MEPNVFFNVFFIDVSPFIQLIRLTRQLYTISWLPDKKKYPKEYALLGQGVTDTGLRVVPKGFSRAWKLLFQNLHGQKAIIILNWDMDLLSTHNINPELTDGFSLLAQEKWRFILFFPAWDKNQEKEVETALISLLTLGGEQTQEADKRTRSMLLVLQRKFYLVLTGFFHQRNYLYTMIETANEYNIHNLEQVYYRTKKIFSNALRVWQNNRTKILIWVDEPLDTPENLWARKNSFYSFFSSCILQANLPSSILFAWQNSGALARNRTLADWLRARKYSVITLSDFFHLKI